MLVLDNQLLKSGLFDYSRKYDMAYLFNSSTGCRTLVRYCFLNQHREYGTDFWINCKGPELQGRSQWQQTYISEQKVYLLYLRKKVLNSDSTEISLFKSANLFMCKIIYNMFLVLVKTLVLYLLQYAIQLFCGAREILD